MKTDLIKQIQTNPFFWKEFKRVKREWRNNTLVHKALARGPKKYYSDLCEFDQVRLARKLFNCITKEKKLVTVSEFLGSNIKLFNLTVKEIEESKDMILVTCRRTNTKRRLLLK